MLPNFSEDELRCKGTGELRLAPGFAQALQGMRDALGHPMIVNSCCRAPSHNESVGGHPRSLHLTEGGRTNGTCAVDIRARKGEADEYRLTLAGIAWKRGWSIGYHDAFLHLDLRTEYAGLQQVRFRY